MDVEELLDSGVVIIDKPPKLSSHEVTALVKKITGAARAGHAGTLDPDVSGVLPVALGRATKLLDYIVAKEKIYVGIIKFRHPQAEERILEFFSRFSGEIIQTPPKMSAVRKVPRKRTIFYIKLLEHEGNLALFEVKAQAGTYIRTLCDDIGKQCGGARMIELRRIAVGDITEKECVTMQDLSDAVWLWKEKKDASELLKMIKPAEKYLANYPKIIVKDTAIPSLLNGAQLTAPGVLRADPFASCAKVALFSEGGKFVGMAEALVPGAEISSMNSGFVARTERMHLRRAQ